MNNPNTIRFIALITGVVLVAGTAAIAAAMGQDGAANSLGTVAVGLIGVLRMPETEKLVDD